MSIDEKTGLAKLTDTIESVITGIPAPIRKNFFKAFAQLCTAAVDVPVAWLEGKAVEIRATTESRQLIIKTGGQTISERLAIHQEYINRASSKFASKIIREQINLDDITLNAANELANNKELNAKGVPVDDISDDWLNEFENLARQKSSENMKFIFGKILSVELAKPGSFSIRTLKLISQLDNDAATLFQLLCSQAISMRIGNHIHDARVVSFEGRAGSNSLGRFGLPFDSLNILQEYGLIITDYNAQMSYSPCIVYEQKQVVACLRYGNKNFCLVPTESAKYDKTLNLRGVVLTKAAKELMDIVTSQKSDKYTAALLEFLKSKYLELVEIK